MSFGVASKGALPAGSPPRAPTERDAPFLQPSFVHISNSPVYEPPFRFPSGAPKERDARLQSRPIHYYILPAWYTERNFTYSNVISLGAPYSRECV